MRVAIAVSGGADSVALLCALQGSGQHALVLSVLHMHHGIRGDAADQDAAFVAQLAAGLGLRLLRRDVDTPLLARQAGKGLEETARTLRYGWFRELLGSGDFDAVATAHTLNDQAETVLHKLVRGAWTEGLGGIHPVVYIEEAGTKAPSSPMQSGDPVDSRRFILRPLLGATRDQIVAWLRSIGQPWCEDATNADLQYTRNRIRHQLLPELATYNPQIIRQMGRLAEIAREEEAYWEADVGRRLPDLLLPGRPVRGGGRANSTRPGEQSLAIEVDRLRSLPAALVRRLLRAAARQLGVSLDFEATTRLVTLLAGRGTANPSREQLTAELWAERTPRELRFHFAAASAIAAPSAGASSVFGEVNEGVEITVPGEGEGWGWRVRCSLVEGAGTSPQAARLRAAKPGDRVQLRYSRGAPKSVKEVLQRMGLPAADRAVWPVLEWQGEIVWMAGAVLEPTANSSRIRIESQKVSA